MKAAVVSSYDHPPVYTDVPDPRPSARAGAEMVVDVVAAGLHPRVRSQADGSHYTTKAAELPFVPGIDGVGRGPDGALRYFVLPDTPLGSMAERVVIDSRRSVVLADNVDATTVAAAINPALSSWLALRQRIQFEAGQQVLILGATGSAGRMAIQIAKLLGAGTIVAAGRNGDRLAELPALGATSTVGLGDLDALGHASSTVDIVLDYIWGAPTAAAMAAVISGRRDRRAPLTWVEIGSVAGPTAAIPSAALRAARVQIVGSGQGSVSTAEIVGELPPLVTAITRDELVVGARAVPLANVETAWTSPINSRERLVIVP